MTARKFSTSDHDSVLEFLNTVLPGNERCVDLLRTDEDVVLWLRKTGYLNGAPAPEVEADTLASEARSLREVIRELIAQRKTGTVVDIGRLNEMLASGGYRLELTYDCAGNLITCRKYTGGQNAQLLLPVAMAAADLLASGDFKLIRKCEGDRCPLWFYDRTKAHRRRWCNMSLCGNRQKVARFRTRTKCD